MVTLRTRSRDGFALTLDKKAKGQPVRAAASRRDDSNVVDLMDALRASLRGGSVHPAKPKGKKRKVAAGQREMLLPIAGKKKPEAEKREQRPAARKRAR